MIVQTCESRAELEAAKSLASTPETDQWAQRSMAIYQGNLDRGTNRSEATLRRLYATAIPEGDETIDDNTSELLRRTLHQKLLEIAQDTAASIYLHPADQAWAEQHGIPIPPSKHHLIRPLHITRHWVPADQQNPMIALRPVQLPGKPSSLATADALKNGSIWTGTSDNGNWPSGKVTGIDWTNLDGQIGAVTAEEASAAIRQLPHRVESLRIRIQIDTLHLALPAQWYIDDRLRVTTAAGMSGDTDMLHSYIKAAAAMPDRLAELDPDSCYATALAHTCNRSDATRRYRHHLIEKYLTDPLRIIDDEGQGYSPSVFEIRLPTGQNAVEEALTAIRAAAEQIREINDVDLANLDKAVEQMEAVTANLKVGDYDDEGHPVS